MKWDTCCFQGFVLPGLSSLGHMSTQFKGQPPARFHHLLSSQHLPLGYSPGCLLTLVSQWASSECWVLSLSSPSPYQDAWCRVVHDAGLPVTIQNSLCAFRQVMASVFYNEKLRGLLGWTTSEVIWQFSESLKKLVVYRLAFHGSCAGVMIYNNSEGDGKNREHILNP